MRRQRDWTSSYSPSDTESFGIRGWAARYVLNPVSPSNSPPSNGALSEVGTGIFLPDNSTDSIIVSGTVHLERTPGYSGDPNAAEESVLAGTSISPAGLLGQLHVSLNVGSGTTGTDTTTEVWLVRVNAGFELKVARTGVSGGMGCNSPTGYPPGCECPDGPCYSYSVPAYAMTSSQLISVKRLDDDVTLTAVPSNVVKGHLVTFTPHAASPGGAMNWTWTPDSGTAQTVACSYGANPCIDSVYESGTMDVYYDIPADNGQPHLDRHAKTHVSVIECPSSDSLLNDPGVRAAFMRLDSLTNPSGPENTRNEHVAALLSDSSGFLSVLDIPTIAPTNNCLSTWVPPSPSDLGGDQLIAIVHTHPYAVGETVHCSDGRSFSADAGGSSGYDWPTMRSVNNSPTFQNAHWHVPFYIIDTNNIYRMNPDGQPGSDITPVVVWKGGSCDWH